MTQSCVMRLEYCLLFRFTLFLLQGLPIRGFLFKMCAVFLVFYSVVISIYFQGGFTEKLIHISLLTYHISVVLCYLNKEWIYTEYLHIWVWNYYYVVTERIKIFEIYWTIIKHQIDGFHCVVMSSMNERRCLCIFYYLCFLVNII